jgi:hypothetical protein
VSESAVFPDCLLRDYESGRGGRAAQCFVQAARNRVSFARFDAKAVFVFEGTPELPLAQAVKAGFDEVETCEHLSRDDCYPMGESPFP